MKLLLKFALAAGLFGSSLASAAIVTVNLTVLNDQSVTISLDPVSGILSGYEGGTVGWGFTLTADTAYGILANASDFCTSGGPDFPSPCTTDYTDLIGFTNGEGVNAGDPTLDRPYDTVLGFGSLVVPSSNVVGFLVFYYQLINDLGNPVGAESHVSFAAEVNVLVVPEPGTWGMMFLAFAGLAVGIRRKAVATAR